LYQIPSASNNENGLVGLLFIDTTTLAPSENKCCNENGGISNITQLERISNQMYHIERNLIKLNRKKNLKWLLCFGHYPIFSYGEHGDTDELVNLLEPVFLRYNVSAYFSGNIVIITVIIIIIIIILGHDHITEHISHNGIEYFVTGAGITI